MIEAKEIKTLIGAAIDGDSDAFNELYRYSFPTVEGECLKVLHGRQNVDDVMQESYIKIYKNLAKLKDPEKFLGWCRHIAHNEAVDFIKNRDRKAGQDEYRPVNSNEEEMGLDLIVDYDPLASVEEYSEAQIAKDILQLALDEIPEQQATALRMNLEGYKLQEIADIMNVPLGTAKSNVHYAKKRMEKAMSYLKQEEGIVLHGFYISPAGLIILTKEHLGDTLSSGGWIGVSADETGSITKHQSELWKDISKKLSLTTSNAGSFRMLTLIIAGVMAVFVAITGILLYNQNSISTSSPQGGYITITVSGGDDDSENGADSEVNKSNTKVNSASPDYSRYWDDDGIQSEDGV